MSKNRQLVKGVNFQIYIFSILGFKTVPYEWAPVALVFRGAAAQRAKTLIYTLYFWIIYVYPIFLDK